MKKKYGKKLIDEDYNYIEASNATILITSSIKRIPSVNYAFLSGKINASII